jgi:hypothetical protein
MVIRWGEPTFDCYRRNAFAEIQPSKVHKQLGHSRRAQPLIRHAVHTHILPSQSLRCLMLLSQLSLTLSRSEHLVNCSTGARIRGPMTVVKAKHEDKSAELHETYTKVLGIELPLICTTTIQE